MAVLKCKMCDGDLSLVEGASTAVCEFCGTVQTVPTADNEKKMALFARANRLRAACEFDKAAGIYESIVAEFSEEAEAYWGLILCKYGIEYVDDPATGKKIPTCHRSSFDCVLDDSNFEMVMENADTTARRVYRDEAKTIEELRKSIVEVSSKEEPYDIFICYKETAEDGQRTLDSVLAQDIYDALTEKGYRVFFSRVTLEDKLGQEYEPYIFAALNSAKIMLAVGTDYEYYNAVWVKNEWSRFLQLMTKDKSKHLIPCFKGIDAYDMPKEFAKLQAQNLGKVGAMQDLLRGIEKLLPKVQNGGVPVSKRENPSDLEVLIRNGETLLKLCNYNDAKKVYDRMTSLYPYDYRGWWGLIVCNTLNFTDVDCDYKALGSLFSYVQKLADKTTLVQLTRTIKTYLRAIAEKESVNEKCELSDSKYKMEKEAEKARNELLVEKSKKEQEEKRYKERLDQLKTKIQGSMEAVAENEPLVQESTWKVWRAIYIIMYVIAGWSLLFGGWEGDLQFALVMAAIGFIIMMITEQGDTKGQDKRKQVKTYEDLVASGKAEERKEIAERERMRREAESKIKGMEEHFETLQYRTQVLDKYIKLKSDITNEYWFANVCVAFNLTEPCRKEIIEMHREMEQARDGTLKRPNPKTVEQIHSKEQQEYEQLLSQIKDLTAQRANFRAEELKNVENEMKEIQERFNLASSYHGKGRGVWVQQYKRLQEKKEQLEYERNQFLNQSGVTLAQMEQRAKELKALLGQVGSSDQSAGMDRTQPFIICPNCGTKQRSNRNICLNCGIKFRSL